MERYKCSKCRETFNFQNPFDMEKSDSDLVKMLISRCPFCGSFEYELTEHGKLLLERQKKIEKLNDLNK